jgi:hypothetical protein
VYAAGGSSCVGAGTGAGNGTGAPPALALALALAVLSCEVAFVSALFYLVPCATISTVALLCGKK